MLKQSPKKPPRRRLGPDERRELLLRAAWEVFVERPYDGVSLEDVAARAGTSKALVLHYFGDKRSLYVATLREAAAALLRATEPDPSWPPETRLRRGLDAYLEYAEAAGEGYVALLQGGVGADPEVYAVVEDTRRAIIERALASMGLSSAPPVVWLALRSWIGFVEAASVEYLRKRQVSREVLLELVGAAAVAAMDKALSVAGVTR